MATTATAAMLGGALGAALTLADKNALRNPA